MAIQQDPRPPRLEQSPSHLRIDFAGVVLADSRAAYRHPAPNFAAIRDHVAFYPAPMDGCFVDGERVRAQSGDFYGGWITSDIVGPLKGEAGTRGW